jgi:hypothetical protein
VAASVKSVEKDLVERAEMEHEARRIKLYNSYGKPVTPAFSSNPVLKQVEKMKKMSDAEELAARKAEVSGRARFFFKNNCFVFSLIFLYT